jgi:hypothetical protein
MTTAALACLCSQDKVYAGQATAAKISRKVILSRIDRCNAR